MTRPQWAGAWACVLWLAACAGTETGNPSFEGSLSYNAHSSSPQAVALLSGDDDAVVVDAAWLVLGDVGFVPSDRCDPTAPTEVHAEGLGIGDHAPTTAVDTPLVMERGSYCGMHLPFVRTSVINGTPPPELIGHSVLINGSLPDGRTFSLASAFEGDMFLGAIADDFEMDADNGRVLVGFDVALWLGNLDWTNATTTTGNRVIIDSDNNVALLNGFEQRLALGTSLYRDHDGTGQITPTSQQLAVGAP